METIFPVLQFEPAGPINLAEVLELQARKLIEIGVPREVRVTEDKFLDGAMAKANGFTYSIELANTGLDNVCIVHYGVCDSFLCEAGGVTVYPCADNITLYKGVVVPEGIRVIQCQFGLKYRNRKPIDICNNHDEFEELGIPKEGLTGFIYQGKDLLRMSYMDFPGARTAHGYVPYLCLHGEEPVMSYSHEIGKDRRWGSVSRGRI